MFLLALLGLLWLAYHVCKRVRWMTFLRRFRTNRQGFTLVQILIAVFVISILTAIAIPMLTIPSVCGGNVEAYFNELSAALAHKDLRAADQITTDILLTLAGHPDEDYLTTEELTSMKCSCLQRLDRLWTENSNEKFGFSVQYDLTEPYRSDPNLTRSEKWEKTLDTLFGESNDGSREYLDDFDEGSVPAGSFPRWQRLKEPSDTNWQLLTIVSRCGLS